MCTVVVLVRPGHAWPVLFAANRDERVDRLWDAPASYWAEHPGVVAGRDRTGGGTWMGVNRDGVVTAVLNRQGTLGPAEGKRSRGVLPLIALEQPTAQAAVAAITALDAGQWRGFNMVLADARGAVFVRGLGSGHPKAETLAPGLHMITAHEPNDPQSPRVARHFPRLQAANVPAPPDWDGWRAILADQSGPAGTEINIPPHGGFGTVSSALVGLGARTEWFFAGGAPHEAAFVEVPI
ncbi:MAG: hypothetical protein EXR05_04420 [Acetobacteraceae bacterium]|nr:hypothetical protein [Acetobacteraceae bacterium]MSP31135.1 hypothetical protein [Acetobacteraceae bacterium]